MIVEKTNPTCCHETFLISILLCWTTMIRKRISSSLLLLVLLLFVLVIEIQNEIVTVVESFTPTTTTMIMMIRNYQTPSSIIQQQKHSHHWLSKGNSHNIFQNKNSIPFLQRRQLHLLPTNTHEHPVSLQQQQRQTRQQQSVFSILSMTSSSSLDSRTHNNNNTTTTETTIFSSNQQHPGIKQYTPISSAIHFDNTAVIDKEKCETEKWSRQRKNGKEDEIEGTNDLLMSSIKRIVTRSEDILMLDPADLNKKNNNNNPNKNTQSLLQKLTYWERDASSSHEWMDNIQNTAQPLSRRMVFGSTLLGLGTALQTSTTMAYAKETTKPLTPTTSSASTPDNLMEASSSTSTYHSKLLWQVTPVNKRTGVTVFDAEQSGYTVAFVTYLSRFLLCFDRDCQRWWYNHICYFWITSSSVVVGHILIIIMIIMIVIIIIF